MSQSLKPGAFEVQIDYVDDVAVISANGNLCDEPTCEIGKAVTRVLEDGARRIVIDLSLVDDAEGHGLADMAAGFLLAREQRVEVAGVLPKLPPGTLVSPNPQLGLYECRAEALTALAEVPGKTKTRPRSWWSRL